MLEFCSAHLLGTEQGLKLSTVIGQAGWLAGWSLLSYACPLGPHTIWPSQWVWVMYHSHQVAWQRQFPASWHCNQLHKVDHLFVIQTGPDSA
jgi:hypothetical protein